MKYLYVAWAGVFSKIGISKHPVGRLRNLKHKPVQLEWVIESDHNAELEAAAMTVCGDEHQHGEYFMCTPRLLITAVKHIAAEHQWPYQVIVDRNPDRWLESYPQNPWKLEAPWRKGLRQLSTLST